MHSTPILRSLRSGLSLLRQACASPGTPRRPGIVKRSSFDKLRTSLGALAASSLLALGAQAQTNLLQAGDFEGISSVTSYWPSTPGVWGAESAALSGAANGVTPFGSQMLRLNHAGGGTAAQTAQIVQGPFAAGSVVTFTAKFNTWLNGQAVHLDIQTNTGFPLDGPRVSSPTVVLDNNPSTWETVTVTTTLTSSANFLSGEILLSQNSNGALFGQPRAYVDDVVLTVTPPLQPQTLTILGGNGSFGEIAADVEYYNPVAGQWQPAYLVGTHPWGQISGTNSWINYRPSTQSDPGVGPGKQNVRWYLYRVRFTVPADAVNPEMEFSVKADNFVQVAVNGITTGGSTQIINGVETPNVIEGEADQLNADAVFAQAVQPGENTITLKVGDYGGLNGFNFRIDLSMLASQPLEVVPPDPADTTPPVINVPADITKEATSAAGAIVTFSATAVDAKDGPVSVIASPASGSTFPFGTTTVGLAASDAALNTATASFQVTVQDTTAPILIMPPSQTLEATGPGGAIATFAATATDAVGATVTYAPAPGSLFPLGTNTVTITAKDAANNTTTDTFRIVVRDTTKPVLLLPANLSLEATSAAGAVANYEATATDSVSGNVPVALAPPSGSTFALGTTTVQASATDGANNTAQGSFTVTVSDTTKPVLTLPDDLTLEATGPDGAIATFAATATDAVSTPAIHYSIESGTTFAIGTTAVEVTATDAAGNAAIGSFNVTVQDMTAPTIASPGDLIAEATSADGASVSFEATAADIVDGSLEVTATPASGTTFAIGATTVTLTATDAAGNSASTTFTVTVRDTTAPVLAIPASQTLEATGPNGASAIYSATATDIVSGNVPVAFSPASGATFALGTNTVTATAIDAAGNAAIGGFTITVRDTTAPVITAPANQILEATGPNGASATFSASALDIVDGDVAVTASPASGSTFALGTTTVTLSVTDAANNASSATFTVTVRDTTAPTLTVPGDIVADSPTLLGIAVPFAVSANDIVGGSRPVSLSHAPGSVFPIGTTVVTATTSDAAGNTASRSFKITVRVPASAVVNQISALNGTIAGSIQQIDDRSVTLNGNGEITGDLKVVGTPTVRLNGKPSFGGAVDGSGAASPSNYTITLNGNASLGRLVRRTDPVAIPSIAAPNNPTGTRSVNVNKASDSIGAWSTVKDLTLNGNVGNVAVPAGVYGNFTANGKSGFTLGVAGATTPSVYHFQNLTLNGNSQFNVVGPVIVIVKNGLNANGAMGNASNPAWLDLRISNGGLTLNGNVTFNGYVVAPKGSVTINGNSDLTGGLVADKLTVDGNGTLTLLAR